MDARALEQRAYEVIEAWNTQDVARVVECYTEDLVYVDANTRGTVNGRKAFSRYLSKLFDAWKMQWSIKEFHPFEGGNGGAFLWRARLGPVGGGPAVEIDGMDLVLLRGNLLARNEVYFDRALLAQALAA